MKTDGARAQANLVTDELVLARWRSWLHLQKLATIGLSLLAILLFLIVAFKRLRYPFELDRMESGMMTTVWRVAHGMPVYVRPSLEWAPFLYSPLFFYVSAFLAKLTGLSYAALRLTSILATLGSCSVLALLVYRETHSRTAAWASAGLFAMLYSHVLSWYDIGRVDSLSLFLFLLAVYCMRFTSPVLAAGVWVLAFQTKQSFLPLAVLAFFVYWQTPRKLLLGLGSFAVFAVASIWFLNHITYGWYSYYVFGAVPGLALSTFFAKTYLPFDLLQPLALALGLIVLAVLVHPPLWRGERFSFYFVLSVLVVGGIWFARAHVGSYYNTLMPVYAWICLLFGLALGRLTPSKRNSSNARTHTLQEQQWALLIWMTAFSQIAMHLYRPGAFAPSTEAAKVRLEFLDRLRHTPGDIWLVNHSYDGILAGKGMHAEMDAFDSVLGRQDKQSIAEVQEAIRSHHFSAIFLDRAPETYSPPWLFTGSDFQHQYPLQALAPGAPLPTTGDQPIFMYLACQPAPRAMQALSVGSTFTLPSSCRQP